MIHLSCSHTDKKRNQVSRLKSSGHFCSCALGNETRIDRIYTQPRLYVTITRLQHHLRTPAPLHGSRWLSPPISSQCSCGRCPLLCHVRAPRTTVQPGHAIRDAHAQHRKQLFQELLTWGQKKNYHICVCLFKHIDGRET